MYIKTYQHRRRRSSEGECYEEVWWDFVGLFWLRQAAADTVDRTRPRGCWTVRSDDVALRHQCWACVCSCSHLATARCQNSGCQPVGHDDRLMTDRTSCWPHDRNVCTHIYRETQWNFARSRITLSCIKFKVSDYSARLWVHCSIFNTSSVKQNRKAQLLLEKTRYSLYSSCCSTTDLQGHPKSMIFMSFESQYAIFY